MDIEFLSDVTTLERDGGICNQFMIEQKNGREKRSPWGILTEFPPPLIRLLAKEPISRKHIRALSDREVAIGAEMSLDKVRLISRSKNWERIRVGDLRMFCQGCNFDPFDYKDRNRVRAYSRNTPKFSYLKASPYWGGTFLPLIKILENA
jgi:hypothetical protein